MEDRVTRAYYWAGLAAIVACFASLVVLLTVAAPGFNVLKDREKVSRLIDPAFAVAADPARAG